MDPDGRMHILGGRFYILRGHIIIIIILGNNY